MANGKWISVKHPSKRAGRLLCDWSVYVPSPACYVVYSKGRHVYVGSAIHLRRRMGAHTSSSSPWCNMPDLTVKYRPSVKYGDWAMVELRLIRRLLPELNMQCKGAQVA